MIISPSVLSADFANLGRDIEMLNNSEAGWIHVDIMDGVFVPNISFGFPVMAALKKYARKPLDVHLMIIDADKYIPTFAENGATSITVHYEACTHLHRTIQLIKSFKLKAGVALNPHTPVSALENILDEIDLVLIMSVNPGFGGQKFISSTIDKVKALKNMITSRGLKVMIEVDGGVDLTNASLLAKAGADALVAGNAVFSTENPAATIKKLKSAN
jgi:ribulose-phosphate 3-epimerase